MRKIPYWNMKHALTIIFLRIGEEVIIENKWYLVENIVNRYKKLKNSTFTNVYIYLKELEEEK